MSSDNRVSTTCIPEVTLSRDLGLFTITMIGVGAMIGAGIFVLTGTAAGIEGTNVVESVLEQSKGYDLIVVVATEEPLLRNLLIGNIAEEIARRAGVTVIMVTRRSSPLRSFLRQTLLEPTTRKT